MKKEEQFEKMRKYFKKEVNFFKYIGCKTARQSLYQYKNNSKINKSYSIILELIEKLEKIKENINTCF